MHAGMTLQEMLTEVVRQSDVKQDYLADTKETIRMVRMPDFKDGVAMVLQSWADEKTMRAMERDSVAYLPTKSILQRFEITNNCHDQLASRLGIPLKYYRRLLVDHTDLVIENVNTLFEREPATRMIRTLDGKARAFLSDSYKRVDNDEILQTVLPVIKNDFPTRMLNSYVDENKMRVKGLFTGDEHSFSVGETRDGKDDVMHTGFEIGNSEVGGGSFYVRGFTYRSYCLNGCVWGGEETVAMRRVHVGSKLAIPTGFVLGDDTRKKEDAYIISAARDTLAYLSTPEFAQTVGNRIRAMRNTPEVSDAHAAVDTVCKQVGIGENDSKKVLESFIRDQDYSQWGMVNAVTSVQHSKESYDDASEFEALGAKIIDLNRSQWTRIANLEKVAA